MMSLHTKTRERTTYAAMRKAPEMRTGLRPSLSTQMTAGYVAMCMLVAIYVRILRESNFRKCSHYADNTGGK